MKLSLRLVLGFVVTLMAFPALAQRELCYRLRAELASLEGEGGNPRAEAAAGRVRSDIARLTNAYRSMGCEGRGFLIFNAPPPPECGAIGARIEQLQGQHARLARQAEGGSRNEGRRQQLIAAMNQACRVQAEPTPLYETLFGRPRPDMQEPVEVTDEEREERRARGGSRAVCVRSCDGYFFPLNNLPNGREGANEMCQALCPGSEARAYFMPGGDGSIEQAVSVSGEAYTSLPNASKYQKSFDAACTCRPQGLTWLQALRNAEEMIERRKSDIIVTAQKSEELSRAKTTSTIPEKETKLSKAEAARLEAQKRKEEAEKREADSMASQGEKAPTASKESAGIGPQMIETNKTISRDSGAKAVITAEDGTKKQVRVVAPDLIAPFKPR